ncbi:hypothetical protein QQ045_032246 [Rhodiola kirilowii]
MSSRLKTKGKGLMDEPKVDDLLEESKRKEQIKKERAEARLKKICLVCRKVAKEATIIEVCQHKFCKSCITRKITEERYITCPVCLEEIGCEDPILALRPDPTASTSSSRKKREVDVGISNNGNKSTAQRLAGGEEDSDYEGLVFVMVEKATGKKVYVQY